MNILQMWKLFSVLIGGLSPTKNLSFCHFLCWRVLISSILRYPEDAQINIEFESLVSRRVRGNLHG